MTVNEAIDIFLKEQKARGNTLKTIDNYSSILGYFADFSKNIDVNLINKPLLLDYIIYLQNRIKNIEHKYKKHDDNARMSSITIKSYCRHLKVFLNWLYENDYIDINVAAKFRLPKAQKKLISILTPAEIDTIFKCVRNTNEFPRNTVCIALMLYSGLRLSEVCSLKTENVFLDKKLIKVMGKGQKERIVPINDFTYDAIRSYLSFIQPSEYFILNRDRKKITKDALSCLIRRISLRTGIKKLHPHLFRHTFATRYLISGGDVNSLSLILGHTTLKMTETYVHLATSYSISNYRKYC